MGYRTLDIVRDGRGVATLTLNRPEKRNALSAEMIAELTDVARAAAADPPRVVVLRGAGKVFCAGGDLDWMRAQMAAGRATRMAAARALAEMLRALDTLPCPLIGRLHGGAFGGGVGLACVCDVTLAADDTRFGLTETRLGLIPATIAPYLVARLGAGASRRVVLSGRSFDAAEAARFGVIASALPVGALDDAVAAEIAHCLAAAPGAVARAKRLMRELGPRIDDAVIADTVARLADAWEDEDASRGIAAFFEGRAPPWRVD